MTIIGDGQKMRGKKKKTKTFKGAWENGKGVEKKRGGSNRELV